MVTMIDEIYDRHYQAGRAELNAGLDRAFARIGYALRNGFAVLNRVSYDAPWAPRTGRSR